MWGALSRLFVKSDNISGNEDDDDEGAKCDIVVNVLALPSSPAKELVDAVEEAAEVEFVQSSKTATAANMEKNSQDMTDTLESKQVRFLAIKSFIIEAHRYCVSVLLCLCEYINSVHTNIQFLSPT